MAEDLFTILIVDDDPNDVFLFKRAFQENKIPNPLRILSDGAEAIACLEEASAQRAGESNPYPGLIILDLKMPRKTGLEVLMWLKDHPECYVIPTIIFTSSSQLIDVKLSYAHGANSFIVKPAALPELKAVVKTIYDYWNLCQKLVPEKSDAPPSTHR